MCQALAQMSRRFTANVALRQDLLQEAMVHLWLTETRRPGQTRSWYLQSCRFHLHHYLNSGRSIDSAKRWRDQLPLDDNPSGIECATEPGDAGNSVLTSVSAREIVSLLAPLLSRQEQSVLAGLADGLGPRELGRRLKLSHAMVIRHRRKIAKLVTKLELPPFRRSNPPNPQGVNSSREGDGNGRHALENGTAKARSSSSMLGIISDQNVPSL